MSLLIDRHRPLLRVAIGTYQLSRPVKNDPAKYPLCSEIPAVNQAIDVIAHAIVCFLGPYRIDYMAIRCRLTRGNRGENLLIQWIKVFFCHVRTPG